MTSRRKAVHEGEQDPTAHRRALSHRELWGERFPVVPTIHLPPLPGSPRWGGGSLTEVLARAREEALLLQEEGASGLLVENYGDAPFYPRRVPPETVAAMTAVVADVAAAVRVPVGVNVLRNDAHAALAVAVATGARFIRVNVHTGTAFTDQGLIEGKAHETLRLRAFLGAPVSILADVFVKHSVPPPGAALAGAARDCWLRGLADGLILTGPETGQEVDLAALRELREALPAGTPLWAGSGVTPTNAHEIARLCDGIIVASALREGGLAGHPLVQGALRELLCAVEEVRGRG